MQVDPNAVPTPSRRRRQRLPAHQIRSAMFTAARELVYVHGVQISLEELSFEQVITRAGVPRSSAYRLWPYKGDFVDDLLRELAGPSWLGAAAYDQQTIDLTQEIVRRCAGELVTAEGRRRVMLQAVRLAVQRNYTALVESEQWHIYAALNATVGSEALGERRSEVAAALQHSEMTFIDRMADFYTSLLTTFGMRFRDPSCTVRHLAMAGAAVVEGLALRRMLVRAVDRIQQPPVVPEHGWTLREVLDTSFPGPDRGASPGRSSEPDSGQGDRGGSRQEEEQGWSLAALAFMGIVQAMCEPVPDSDVGTVGSGRRVSASPPGNVPESGSSS